jgi:hypothetical protein
MLSARAFNRLANISLAAGILILVTTVSVELAKWTRGEARESAPQEFTSENAPEIMPVRVVITNDQTDPIIRPSEPMRLAQLNGGLGAVAGATRSAVPPREAKLASLPVKSGIIFEELGRKVCIGGTQCEEHCRVETDGCIVQPAYAIRLERSAYISAIQLYAHDQVGPTRRASLLVKVNGDAIGKTEVYRFGSTLTVKIGRVGQLVTVESLHALHGFQNGGEEAVIWDVYLLGREPR